jgi:hypothetical protein
MMGLIVIIALLMHGVVSVLSPEEGLRSSVALVILFFYVLAGPVILAITFPSLWPKV